MNATKRPALLTVTEAAERLNTGERFIRRLIDERRVEFVRLGRKIRIPETALDALVQAGTVTSMTRRATRYGAGRAA